MLREPQGVKFLVGAPAFMRGKERFSAPGRASTLIMRFSPGIKTPRAKAHLKSDSLFRWTEVQLPPAQAGGSHQRPSPERLKSSAQPPERSSAIAA